MQVFDRSKKPGRAGGFTLIELLVVISIIGVISGMVMVGLDGTRARARDAKRKSDLAQIRKALEMYYADNDRYPQAGACAYGTNCYANSTSGANWIPALTSGGYLKSVPVDPRNNQCCPWTAGRYTYTYGNVTSNGQAYDLTAQLENSADPDRCAVKQYKFYFTNNNWCGSYSGQIYENSPLSP